MTTTPWQPIETAPNSVAILAAWHITGDMWAYAVASNEGGEWWEGGNMPLQQPTHWMPLPPPPETGE